MQFTQHNPIPLPASGAREKVPSAFDTVFDWEYRLADERLLSLYEKGKAAAWNASDLDWDTPVDLEELLHARTDPEGDGFNELLRTVCSVGRGKGEHPNSGAKVNTAVSRVVLNQSGRLRAQNVGRDVGF